MAASWFGKKDPGEVDPSQPSPPSGEEKASDLRQLTGHLAQLEALLGQANQRIADYLVQRDSQSAPLDEAASGTLGDRIAALAEKLDRLAAAGPAPEASPEPTTAPSTEQTLKTLLEPLEQRLDRLGEGLRQISNLLSAPRAPSAKQPQAGDAPPSTGSAQWEQAILGRRLADDPALAFPRQQLLGGVLDGDRRACSLAGRLLLFQAAPAERLPPLLKEIGEAYYRWQPKTSPGTIPLEEAMVRWLQNACEAVGISNTIELVHPGERFDSARHSAASRGVEITEVRGWIVLRAGGKVYTKASVAVR